MKVFLLQRRGAVGSGYQAIIAVAPTEAHARVDACNQVQDVSWGDNGYTACREISTDKPSAPIAIYVSPIGT